MKKNILKILLIIMIITIIIFIGKNNVFADSGIINPENYVPTTENTSAAASRVATIFSVIQIIGIIVAVITVMIIGIKYMIGSIEEKAEYKKTMLPWIIGAIIVLFVTSIPTLLKPLVEITDSSATSTGSSSGTSKPKIQIESIKPDNPKIGDKVTIKLSEPCTYEIRYIVKGKNIYKELASSDTLSNQCSFMIPNDVDKTAENPIRVTFYSKGITYSTMIDITLSK